MPTISCEFAFNRTPATYYSGEQVSGKVALTTTKDLEVEVLQINCKGVGNVSWYARARQSPYIEYNDGADEHQKLQYQGHEVYVNETRSLQKYAIIYAGRHEYKFLFNLPANCPATSTHHKFGEIFYSISLLLKRDAKFDKKFEQRFVVKTRLNLNVNANKYMTPVLKSHYLKNIDTEVQFSIPHTGYVPGQDVKFRLDVATTTTVVLRYMRCKVRLYLKYTFKCQQPSAESKEIIWKLAKAKFSFGDKRQEANSFESSLHLPLMTPITSEQKQPAIICVSYYLEALVFTKQKLLLTKLCIPITVGSKALKNISESSCERDRFCYDNVKVENIYKISTPTISSEAHQKALQNKFALTRSFVKNFDHIDHSITENKLYHNKNN